MAGPVGVGKDVVVEIVDVDRGHAGVQVAGDGEREELSHPHRDADLDGEPLPSPPRFSDGIGDHAEHGPCELDDGQHTGLHDHPGEDDDGGERPHHALSRGAFEHGEAPEVVDGAAREHAAVGAAALEDAAAAVGLRVLDPRRVAAPRKVHVGAPALVVIVKSRDVGTHAVHRAELERRRRRRQSHRHRLHPIPVPSEESSHERQAALGQPLLEDGLRQSVDLDDQEATSTRQGRASQTQASDRAVEQALNEKDQLVERHARLL